MPIGPPTYTPQQAHAYLNVFIRQARVRRARVYAADLTLDGELAACDNALAALNVLRQAANGPAPELPQAEQPGLFGGA